LVYPILDASFLPRVNRLAVLTALGQSLCDAGVTLLEYRCKTLSDADLLAEALALRAAMPASHVRLVLDDRLELVLSARFDGAHLDAGDATPEQGRALLGEQAMIGTSASSDRELRQALVAPVDYIAFGPIFPTATKQTVATPIGIAGVETFRAIAGSRPILVAAAGITLATAPAIVAAGADSVAVAAALFTAADPAAEFRRWMDRLG
jgi:thiamine-phosphate pyrophosphorylase